MAMTLITTNTSSNAASSSFTSSIDSTYKLYIFKFIDVNPATDAAEFSFQVNATDGADYNDSAITSSTFYSSHNEDDSGASLQYTATHDQAQVAGFQPISWDIGNGADENCAGTMWLFNPSNTTYVKHFYSNTNFYFNADYSVNIYTSGYFNVTGAITEIQFKMDSGNMDSVIKENQVLN